MTKQERRKEYHDYENRREDITSNQTLHQRGARARLRRLDRFRTIKGMVGTRRRSDAEPRRRRACWRQISLGPYKPGRRGNERVRRIPGADPGKEDCLHLEMG